MNRPRLAVLASGRGSNLQAILDACKEGRLNAEVVVVLSDQEHALALERANKEGIPSFWVNPAEFSTKKRYEEKLVQVINGFAADYALGLRRLSCHRPTRLRGRRQFGRRRSYSSSKRRPTR